MTAVVPSQVLNAAPAPEGSGVSWQGLSHLPGCPARPQGHRRALPPGKRGSQAAGRARHVRLSRPSGAGCQTAGAHLRRRTPPRRRRPGGSRARELLVGWPTTWTAAPSTPCSRRISQGSEAGGSDPNPSAPRTRPHPGADLAWHPGPARQSTAASPAEKGEGGGGRHHPPQEAAKGRKTSPCQAGELFRRGAG